MIKRKKEKKIVLSEFGFFADGDVIHLLNQAFKELNLVDKGKFMR